MVLLQNKLNLKVSQKQVLTPGLVQMVSVLALNKLELKDMINEEMVENPVLEEVDSTVLTFEEIAAKEEKRDRIEAEDAPAAEKTDSFEEIDFGSFFRDYLDPGPRTQGSYEDSERPSFENFLSSPTTLTDHLMWQLGSVQVTDEVRASAEVIIGNLNEEGYLVASEDEMLGVEAVEGSPTGPSDAPNSSIGTVTVAARVGADTHGGGRMNLTSLQQEEEAVGVAAGSASYGGDHGRMSIVTRSERRVREASGGKPHLMPNISRESLREALQLVQAFDPIGVAAIDLRECLLLQARYLEKVSLRKAPEQTQVIGIAKEIIENHLAAVQAKNFKEIARGVGHPLDEVMKAFEFVRTLDPKPGLRYNVSEARLIEPDVAFVKQGDDWLVMMNDDDLPQLRVSPTYKRLLNKDTAEKDVRNYVKERFKSAIQLIKNIEQRKQTILKVCHSIIERQHEFLERGADYMAPMMIKEVAEEIGVHPSTVSRAVANKYVHTPQGVFELRYFFSESVQGPDGGGTSLLSLKRRVKKLIEDEDPKRPLTDEQLTRVLQSQGIDVTRRTVAKYREDMKIPSTHQRRVKK